MPLPLARQQDSICKNKNSCLLPFELPCEHLLRTRSSPQDDRFRAAKRTYDRQYAQLYFSRLMELKPALLERVARVWPGLPGEARLRYQACRACAPTTSQPAPSGPLPSPLARD